MGEEDVFCGETVLITGAAAGIGKACVHTFLSRGAAVAGADINPHIARVSRQKEYAGFTCDVTDEQAVCNTVRGAVHEFGGLDILVLNAGTFMPSCRIDALPLADLRKVMSINVTHSL